MIIAIAIALLGYCYCLLLLPIAIAYCYWLLYLKNMWLRKLLFAFDRKANGYAVKGVPELLLS